VLCDRTENVSRSNERDAGQSDVRICARHIRYHCRVSHEPVSRWHAAAAPLGRSENRSAANLEHAGIDFDPYKRLPLEVANAIERGKKMQAIKLWRDYTGANVKEAKDFIEEVQRRRAVSRRG
jgi:hypothetical protein